MFNFKVQSQIKEKTKTSFMKKRQCKTLNFIFLLKIYTYLNIISILINLSFAFKHSSDFQCDTNTK